MQTKRTATRGLLVSVTALVASALLLTGCSTKTPDPAPSQSGESTTAAATASPSASAVASAAAPKDSAAAIASATEVAKNYWTTTDQILNDGGAKPERIDVYSTGQAKDYIHKAAGEVLQMKSVVKGGRGFSVTESYSSDLTLSGAAPIKNGFVGLTVCNDITNMQPINADGTPGNKGNVMRSVMTLEAQYDPAAGRWLVSQIAQPSAVIAC